MEKGFVVFSGYRREVGGGRKKMRWRRMVENESDGEGF